MPAMIEKIFLAVNAAACYNQEKIFGEGLSMGLKTKLVLTVNAIVIVACTIMGVIGYLRAEESFIRAMQMKVGSDVNSLAEILNSRLESS